MHLASFIMFPGGIAVEIFSKIFFQGGTLQIRVNLVMNFGDQNILFMIYLVFVRCNCFVVILDT